MKGLITILLFSLTLVSCRKNKPLFDGRSCTGSCYVLTGKLMEVQTGSPLPNTELRFYYRRPGNAIIFNPTVYLGRTITAPDGSYYFTFDSKDFKLNYGYFSIECSKDGYIFTNYGDRTDKTLVTFDLDSTMINIQQVNDLQLYKAATLKIRVKAATITSFEFLTISYRYGTNGYGPALNGRRTIDTTLVYKTASDIPTYIEWNALGNGITLQKKDTLIVPHGAERTYEINL